MKHGKKITIFLFLIIYFLSKIAAQQGAQTSISNVFYDKAWKEVFRIPRGHFVVEEECDFDYCITDPLFTKYKENGFIIFDKTKKQLYAVDRFGKYVSMVERTNRNDISAVKKKSHKQSSEKDEADEFGKPQTLKIGKIYSLEINGESDKVVLKDNKQNRIFSCKNCNLESILGENNFVISNRSFNPETLQTFDSIRVFSIKDKKIVIDNPYIRKIYFANGSIISQELRLDKPRIAENQNVVYDLQGKVIFRIAQKSLKHHFNSKNDVLSFDKNTLSELEKVSLSLKDNSWNDVIIFFRNAKELNLDLKEKEEIPSNLIQLKQLEELTIKEISNHENMVEILQQLPKLQFLTLKFNSFEEVNNLVSSLTQLKAIKLHLSRFNMDKNFNKQWKELTAKYPNIVFEVEIDGSFFKKPNEMSVGGRGN